MSARGRRRTSAAAEHSLYVVAVRIEHERRVVTLRVTCAGIAKPRRTGIGSTRFEGRRMKGVDFRTVPRSEGCVLLRAVGMKAVNPKNRMFDTIADAVSSIFSRGEYRGRQERHHKNAADRRTCVTPRPVWSIL